jgi:hypothetical protein
MVRSIAKRCVSNHEAVSVPQSSFETPGCAGLLRMRHHSNERRKPYASARKRMVVWKAIERLPTKPVLNVSAESWV